MKRRAFLGTGAAGAAALTLWPSWLARAFDPDSSCGTSERLEDLFDGYRAARREGKPLLVIVVPDIEAFGWERGTRWGELLNHGDDATLAAFGLVQLACATMEELSHLVELDVTQAAMFVLVDTAARPARIEVQDRTFAQLEEDAPSPGVRPWVELTDQMIDERIAAFGAKLRAAIGQMLPSAVPGADIRAERVARAICEPRTFGPREPDITAREVLRAGLALYRRAERNPSERIALLHSLASAFRAEVVKKPITGSRWGLDSGCGTQIEGDENPPMYACGMARTPRKSQRFLQFFAMRPDI